MDKQVKIESIKLKLGKRDLTLSLDEAKKLKESLDELFGKQVIHEHHGWWYWSWHSQPVYVENPTIEYPQITWTTTCGTNAIMDNTTDTLYLAVS